MRRALPVAAAFAAFAAAIPARAQHTVVELQQSGPSENRIDLVLVGDGYTAEEDAVQEADLTAAVDHLFANAPYADYEDFFNVTLLKTVSAVSGAGSDGAPIGTFYQCYLGCFDIAWLPCCDGPVMQTVNEQVPAADVVMVVMNTAEYGGSGGQYAIITTSDASADIPPHEFGHTFGNLLDEYEDETPGYFGQVGVNCTATPTELTWGYWVDTDTPLPTTTHTSDLAPVGAFEGCSYEVTGFYRPVYNCLMRNLGSVLCPVCAEAVILSFYGYVEPIDAATPAPGAIAGAPGEVLEFSYGGVQTSPATIEAFWSLDGADIAVTSDMAFALDTSTIPSGAHTLVLRVEDTTGKVREDPDQLMSQSVTWSLTTSGGDADADGGSGDDAGALESHGGSDDGCGCALAGRSARRSFLAALL
jgi:hypothetical protein